MWLCKHRNKTKDCGGEKKVAEVGAGKALLLGVCLAAGSQWRWAWYCAARTWARRRRLRQVVAWHRGAAPLPCAVREAKDVAECETEGEGEAR